MKKRLVICLLLLAAALVAWQMRFKGVPQGDIRPTGGGDFDGAALVAEMTTEEKVGQLFLARCPKTGAVEDVVNYHLGGYILFGRDFRLSTKSSVKKTIAGYQEAASIPLLIAVDEEGGTVTRVSSYWQYRLTKFRSPRELYEAGGLALIEKTEEEKCALLNSLGINVNMAPVCDITTDPEAFMYSRSLGQDPETTGRFAAAVIGVMDDYAMGGVLKHFPGYGNNTDTHTGIAVDDRTLEELEAADLIPFAMGIEAGCGAILVSHTVVDCLDSEYPASLSEAVHHYLRDEIGFGGVIVTDDLSMQAITDLYGAGEAAVLAVLAGNDLLCSSEYQVQYAAVLKAVKSGRIPEVMLNQAAARVLQWKYELGLVREEAAFAGHLTTEAVGRVHTTKAFICPSGVSLEFGITDYLEAFIPVQSAYLRNANQVFILADSEKFENAALLKISETRDDFAYITDSLLPNPVYDLYRENQINIKRPGKGE